MRITDTDRKEFGSKLKEYRIGTLKWKQSEMASFLDVGQVDISRYEVGKTFPSGRVMMALAKNIGVDQFFEEGE